MSTNVNDNSALLRIIKLKNLFENGQIPTLSVHEVHPVLDKSDRINYIYFTLPVSLNFQRSSPAMWQAALKTYEDPETNYLFFPDKVVQESREKIQQDLLKHKLSLQRNKHTDIWSTISKTLHEKYNDDPRILIKKGNHCVVQIKNLLIENKKEFPYLNGLKISNYWMYIMLKYTNVKLRNTHKISIIPDTHVIQSTVQLGLSDDKLKPDEVERIWEKVLKDSGINPVQMHPVLWNWSRNNFLPSV